MKDLNSMSINQYRERTDDVMKLYGSHGDHENGVFAINRKGVALRVIASCGEGWDHISVSLRNRTPTWEEMDRMKRLFFEDWEVAMQLHVPVDQHVNFHPYCLHLWRPHSLTFPIPLPPPIMVAPRNLETVSLGGES